MRRVLGEQRAYRLVRRRNIALDRAMWRFCQRYPRTARRMIRWINTRHLPKGYPVDVHFNPPYGPWDQRLCAVPDGDLFEAISNGAASVVTDSIDTFTEDGILLRSGRELPADIVVTATGLNLKIAGGIGLSLDGKPVSLAERTLYKGMMLSGVPNFAISVGYINASWTLRSDITARAVCRLLNHMNRRGLAVATPRDDPSPERRPLLELSSGYLARAEGLLPMQGPRHPWRVRQHYVLDLAAMRFSKVDEEVDFR
jgi:cation diffusion facilitator CzcD-associated flavoprotein CzcO